MKATKLSQLKQQGKAAKEEVEDMEVPGTKHPTFTISFVVKRSKKVHKVFGVISAELKEDGTLFFYTNGCGGAYFVNNVNKITAIERGHNKNVFATDDETFALIH